MKQVKYIKIVFLIILIVFFAASCGEESKTELTPKGEIDEEVILEQTETISIEKITITVEADAWDGDSTIKNYVTPLKLSIENNNDLPIKITYENIDLINEENDEEYSALPLFEVNGESINPELAKQYKVVVESEVDHDNFYIYPLYTRVYTDIPVTDYEYFEDPAFYEEYYTSWNETGLPTEEMRNKAFPEGILLQGGNLSGFIYFEKVDPDLEEVTLSMDLINAETNEEFGTIQLPFWVMPEYETER